MRLLVHSVSVMCLNPFEVREVLQGHHGNAMLQVLRLNPFEVREVLQDNDHIGEAVKAVSIPLKSGRCCKEMQAKKLHKMSVSIPLKSGRCCKNFRAMYPEDLMGLNPFEVREVLQAPQAACREFIDGLNPFEVREVLQECKLLHTYTHWVSIPLKSGRCCKLT